ncbi:zinc-binding dehydrogenase [Rhodococcus qingshengii]|uniref:zinc-dependent alcohol dehydrogenase n=1 Tax=Rhodococcus qingshengii TaxID=334542 RepID=UPI0036DE7BEF
MRAAVFDSPRSMTLVEFQRPACDEDSVVIDVYATGICGTDVHGFDGSNGRRELGQVMGHETVGTISKVGARISADRIGELVVVNPLQTCGECRFCRAGQRQVCRHRKVVGVAPELAGGFADQLVIPSTNAVHFSREVPILHGALVEPLAVGLHALEITDPTPDDSVLVIGGGPIGQAVALATRRRAISRVLVSEPSVARRELLASWGFSVTSPESLASAVDDVLGEPPTVVVDAVGISPSVQAALDVSDHRARISIVGMGSAKLDVDSYAISTGERSLIGSYCYSDEHFAEAAAWVGAGQPLLDDLVGRTWRLDQTCEAFTDLIQGELPMGKSMVLSQSANDNQQKEQLSR